MVQCLENVVGVAIILARHSLKLHIIWRKINIKIKFLEMGNIIGTGARARVGP